VGPQEAPGEPGDPPALLEARTVAADPQYAASRAAAPGADHDPWPADPGARGGAELTLVPAQ